MRRLEGYQKGVNLGGWLSQGSLTKEHLDTFITEKDIAYIASLGYDHVRVPVDYNVLEDEDGMKMWKQRTVLILKPDTGISKTVFPGAANII